MVALMVAFTTLSTYLVDQAEASNTGLDFSLDGIGYREAALQQAKTSFFQSEDPRGVLYASFSGGVNIFIKGPNLNDNPASNRIWFRSVEFAGVNLPAPPLTEDDAFNSNPVLGFITYRVPSVHELFAADEAAFDTYESLSFYVSIQAPDVFSEERDFKCKVASNCLIRFQKSYTPRVYYISPPVIYYEAYTELWFDPKHTQNVIRDLKSDEMRFVNTEIGGSKLDFEGIVDYTTTFSWWNDNRVKGLVGEMPVGHKQDIKMLWEVGYAAVSETEATHCTYDNSTCYKALYVPAIFNLSSNVGYTSGHQNLTIHGHGFNNDNITVTVDGVDCTVTSYQETSVSCEVQPKSAPSVGGVPQVGSNGMRRKFWNHTNLGKNTWGGMDRYAPTDQYLATSFEVPTNNWNKIGNKLYGWFIAPETTSYRFHLTCDDICDLRMGLNASDPLNTTLIVSRRSSQQHRKHFQLRNDAVSTWVNLTKGEKYYMYGKHEERWHADNFVVGVEIVQSAMVDHHHAMKEIQYIEAQPGEQNHEITRINVTDPQQGGKYYLSFQNPQDLKYWTSEAIPAAATTTQLYNAIKGYYWARYRSNIGVNMTMYMANGTNTTNATLAKTYVYHVKVLKLVHGQSTSNIMVSKQTKATIAVTTPQNLQLSSPPLSGKFRITCPFEGNDLVPDAMALATDGINLNENPRWIQQAIFRKCAGLYDRLEVWSAGKFPYVENGIGFYVRFVGKNGNQTQMRIISAENSPLPEDTVFNQSKVVNASTNLFYEAVPFEMLRTYETKPQVMINVGGIPAVCHNLTCHYNYTTPVGEVTAFTYTAASRLLELTGVNLPANKSLIRHVEFAHSLCTIDEASVSNSSLQCTMDHEPVCGDWTPQLVAIEGLVNTSSTVRPMTITCTVSSVVPTTQLNLLGGDNLTISGTQFPWDMKRSDIDITFDDAQSTKCVPQDSTSTELVCLTNPFDKSVAAGQTVGMSITINGQRVGNSLSMTTMSTTKAGIIVTPPSANPTLKTKINITLESDFPYTLDKNDFSVNATNISNPTYFRQMNVIGVDESTKTIICMFGGAWSGLYQLSIRHRQFGLLEMTGITLTVGSNVTSITPMAGSIYGGTLITITGTNFGKEFTDNPVQISTLGAVGSIDCFLQSISETQITCRVDQANKTDGTQGWVVTFLKVSEEASCIPDSDNCKWLYTAQIPEVTDMQAEWDSTNNYWTVVVTGTGFTGNIATTEFNVNGKKQTTVSVESTKAVFKITDIVGSTLSNMNVYFDVGYPKGFDTVVQGKTIDLEPRLTSISPNVGSVGGSLLLANVQGIGAGNDGVELINQMTGQSICKSTKVRSYGVVECITLPSEIINNGTVLQVKSLKTNAISSTCYAADNSTCMYEQLNNGSFPNVTSIAESATPGQIIFTGENFYTGGFVANVEYAGIQADTVTIDSSTQVTASWNLGFPAVGTEVTPALWFNETGSEVRHYASINSTLTKALTITSGYSGKQCSFAGGCEIQINGEGLSTILRNDSVNNYISVCDEKCEFLPDLSDSSKAICKLPKMSTAFSNENFKIEVQQDDLRFRKTFGNLNDVGRVFDNNLMVLPTISSSQDHCTFGGSFKVNHIGMLSQVKYFLGEVPNKSIYANNLTFQGSHDNSTWTDLFVPDDNIHEGWNYHKWETAADQPRFRFYRFYNVHRNGCLLTEFKMTGVETVDNNDATYPCAVALEMNGDVVQTLSDQVTYLDTLTPLLTSVEPRYGPVTGGTSVTFTGTNFVTDTAKYKIIIDGRICAPTAATVTSVTCTTDHRPGLISPSLEIYIDGMGLISNQGKLFRYVSYWSDDTTWGGEFAPMHMESVYVPEGLNLYVDVDKTPELNLIMVEGSLIFAPHTDPNHERYFDARYIFLNKGYMEVGTEEHPYTSKLTITMHGNISSPYLPVFGNKCIAVRESILDMHGIARYPTWTVMNETSLPGATQIKLTGPVDWVAGEQIGIASTSYDPREAEKRTIKAIDKSNPDIPIVTLDSPLDFKHFAMIQYYGDDFIDMRAEVGLLTRNIKYRGDPETSFANEYGATIFLHSEGDDSLIARLEYIELTDVGQAFKVGRYAVHFHMIGAVHKSYCKGFGTHQSFNRAFTLHGTHYMRLINNVAYDVKGHVIFIEDAVEKKNIISKNLVIMAKRSWSLLNTDQTPACYWITGPDNNFYNNHCGGADRYGFWYDLQIHAIGPHANTNVCPENERVGDFKDNAAHSCGRYGFRIFHNMIPRKYPCKAVTYDKDYLEKGQTDPYWQNPSIPANFDGFTGWKCGRNGAIAGKVGDVRFNNFKVADNLLAGIEVSDCDIYGDNTTRIDNALIIGKTNNTERRLERQTPMGFIGPRTENFRFDNSRFYNWNWGKVAALSTCSHCWHDQETDSGGRTYRVKNMTYDSTVQRRIRFGYPEKEIIFDEDGTTTDKGPQSWATPYYKHHEHPECEKIDYYGGTVCDNRVQLRRVAFGALAPSSIFRMIGMVWLRYDDYLINELADGNATLYRQNKSNYGTINYKEKQEPEGWASPIVTGKKYKIHWGRSGIDFEAAKVYMSERWEEWDHPIYMIHNWTDVRAAIDVKVGRGMVSQGRGYGWYLMPNDTIPANKDDWRLGQNVIYNATEVRETHFIISPKNQSGHRYEEQHLSFVGHRCVGACNEKLDEDKPIENRTRYWNNSADWPNGTVPQEGDDVHIEPGWNMVFNMNPSPIYKLVRINGNLTFDNTTDTHFRAKHLFIRAGELHIGSREHPYTKNCTITLYGERNAQTIAYDNAIEAGNKLIANVNKMRIFGQSRGWQMSRLTAPALKGENEFFIEPNLDVRIGDRLGLLPTSYAPHTVDDIFVEAYDSETGKITGHRNLNYYHWGKAESTAPEYNGLDIRGEVVLLTRNVRIIGEDKEGWGGQVLTGDTIEVYDGEMIFRKGSSILSNVEIYNCSQVDTENAALRFSSASSSYSEVSDSAIHSGRGWGINVVNSANILLKNNNIFGFQPMGMAVDSARNITIEGNVLGAVVERDTLDFDGTSSVDKGAGYTICAITGNPCPGLVVRNNIAAGVVYAGFVTIGHDCGDYGRFSGNVAHSVKGLLAGHGLYFKQAPGQQGCTEYSNFYAYKCYFQGAFAYPDEIMVKMSHMTLVDNREGFGAQVAKKKTEYVEKDDIVFRDIRVYGESDIPDCPQNGNGGYCDKFHKMAFFASQGTWGGKSLHITDASALPPHGIISISTWSTTVKLFNVQFINFKSKTKLGMEQKAFQMHPGQSDFIPLQQFYDTTFINCETDALAYFFEPPKKWAIIKDCGAFPCTAPKNTIFSFRRNKFIGMRPIYAADSFQMIPNTPDFSELVPSCEEYPDMNGYVCMNQEFLGQLVFESEDVDRFDRSSQPIFSRLQGTAMNNKVNSMMDHVWDGFYQGQIRLTRFPILVYSPKGATYDIVYTGSPPKKQKYTLRSQNKDLEMIVRIAYPGAESRQILKDGKRVDMNQWDEKIKMYGEIQRRFCGENRYIGVKNILEFYLTEGCTLQIAPRDAIQTMVRMEWTMDEFFNNGGTTKFIDRVAGSLGIHASTIKVVSVYEGSVVLNYDITVDDADSGNAAAAQKTLAKIKQKQTEQFATGQMDLGAPILDVQASTSSSTDESSGASQAKVEKIISGGVVSAPGYEPIVLTNSAQTQEQQESEFVPDIPIMQVDTYDYIYQNQTVNKDQIIASINNDQSIINIQDRDITIVQGSNNTAMMIILVASGLIVILLFSLLGRFIFNKMRVDQARAQQIKLTQSNLNKNKSIKIIPGGIEQHSPDDSEKIMNEQPSSGEVYEEQYDPNQEFRIFGIGDKTKGGIQTLQEKMNMADDVESDGSSDSDKEQNMRDSVVPFKDMASSNATKSMQNPQSIDENMRSSYQSQERVMSPLSNFNSTPVSSSDKKLIDLPEDQEIIDEEDEEAQEM